MTPLMKQYNQIKSENKDAILFFRLGDFYEVFYDDAHVASRVLGITLTSRSKGEGKIPMAGVPHHARRDAAHFFVTDVRVEVFFDPVRESFLVYVHEELVATRLDAGKRHGEQLRQRGPGKIALRHVGGLERKTNLYSRNDRGVAFAGI